MNKQTPLSKLLRYIADQLDAGSCDLNEPALVKMAELQIKDHDRLNDLTALFLQLQEEHERNHPHPDSPSECKIIPFNK